MALLFRYSHKNRSKGLAKLRAARFSPFSMDIFDVAPVPSPHRANERDGKALCGWRAVETLSIQRLDGGGAPLVRTMKFHATSREERTPAASFHSVSSRKKFEPTRKVPTTSQKASSTAGSFLRSGGPGENWTPDSAMRMPRNTTLLQAQKFYENSRK